MAESKLDQHALQSAQTTELELEAVLTGNYKASPSHFLVAGAQSRRRIFCNFLHRPLARIVLLSCRAPTATYSKSIASSPLGIRSLRRCNDLLSNRWSPNPRPCPRTKSGCHSRTRFSVDHFRVYGISSPVVIRFWTLWLCLIDRHFALHKLSCSLLRSGRDSSQCNSTPKSWICRRSPRFLQPEAPQTYSITAPPSAPRCMGVTRGCHLFPSPLPTRPTRRVRRLLELAQ